MRFRYVMTVVLLLFPVARAQAQEERPPVPTTLAERLRLDALLHLQTSSSSVDSSLGVDAELRRIRVALYGTATETVSAAIQADFDSGRNRDLARGPGHEIRSKGGSNTGAIAYLDHTWPLA